MASKKESKQDQLRRLAGDLALTEIDEAAAAALKQQLQPISDSHFRKIVRGSRFALSPIVEGVRQDSMENLERTLLALLGELESGKREARAIVIEARNHARMAQQRSPSQQREEAVLWMTVWLENASLFREWLVVRKATVVRPIPP